MITIERDPSRRDLLVFACGLPLFFAVVGGLRWHAGSPRTAVALWIVGLALSLPALALPRARLWIYRGWMYALVPFAWLASWIILLAVYFLIATPTALVLRALGRDPMQRRFDRRAESYWTPCEPRRDRARYFRQF